MSDISEARICVQKMLPFHEEEVKKFSLGQSSHQTQRLSAAFWAKKIWPKGSKITIGFLDTPTKITKTPTGQLKVSSRGKLDPLQEEVEELPIQQMIKKIVKERLEPLVNLQLEFVEQNPETANVRIS